MNTKYAKRLYVLLFMQRTMYKSIILSIKCGLVYFCNQKKIFLTKVRKRQRSRIDTIKKHLTQDTICESDENARKHHIQDSKEISPFPTGKQDAARNRHGGMAKTHANNKKDPQKKHRPGMASKRITGGFKLVSQYQPRP